MRTAVRTALLTGPSMRGFHDPDLDSGLVTLSMDFARQRYGYQTPEEAYARANGITLSLGLAEQIYVV